MIIDFQLEQQLRFDRQAGFLLRQKASFFQFEQIADVYNAEWLKAFPQGTQCSISGLDDGADEYGIQISYKHQSILIDYSQAIKLVHRDRDGMVHSMILN